MHVLKASAVVKKTKEDRVAHVKCFCSGQEVKGKQNCIGVVKKAKEDMLNQEVKGGWSIRESKGAYKRDYS